MGTHAAPQHGRTAASGPGGNEHPIAMTGAVLLVGFAVEGATILESNRLLLWSAVMTVHVVAYAPRLPRLLLGSRTPGHPGPSAAPGATARYLAVAAAVAAGIVIASVSMHLQNDWTGGFDLLH